MIQEKYTWMYLYELIGEYVHMRKQHFQSKGLPGESEVANIFDDTAPFANSLMAAAILGDLWPNGAKSFSLGMPFGLEDELGGGDTEEVKDYYEWASKRMAEFMDNPKSGLMSAQAEYMLDQGSFGFSGIKWDEQDDNEVPIAYSAADTKHMCVDEGKNGFVNTIYISKSYTLRQLVEEYGFENISDVRQKSYLDGDVKTKVHVLQAIEPRLERDPYGFGVKDMPFASIHIDIGTEKILRESGFVELPIAVCRFWKAIREKYGRSPAMNALPSILEANALGQAYPIAIEKNLDPPLAVMDDSVLGNGKIDTSAGAINVISTSGRLQHGQKPIEPLFLVGELNSTNERRAELRSIIERHFFQDLILDQNRDPRMTKGEYDGRSKVNGRTLNPVYQRQLAECYVPMIEGTFNSLRRRGFLGVIKGSHDAFALESRGVIPKYIPDAIAQRMVRGEEVYKIVFNSPAVQAMNAAELEGINQTVTFVTNIAGIVPDVLDILDMDKTVRIVQERTGAPRAIINSTEAIQKARQMRAQAQQAAAQSATARQDSETARNAAQAASTMGMAPNSGQVGTAAQ